MDKLSLEQRQRNMRAVKSKGSKIETLLAKAMWAKGFRYRKNDTSVFGKPDFTFKKHKLAIFCDSEFWHGKDWVTKKLDHKSNIKFWHQKIERNIQRDIEVNQELLQTGWKVIRFWGNDIEKDLVNCVIKIEEKIDEAKRKDNT